MLDRILLAVRTEGTRAFPPAVTATGVVAGLLSASAISRPLWFYIGLLLAFYTLVVLWLASNRPRYRYFVAGLALRRRLVHDASGHPHIDLLIGTRPSAPVSPVLASSCPDAAYYTGLRALVGLEAPIIITASSPRDVEAPDEGVPRIYRDAPDDTPIVVDVADGFPRRVEFLRALPGASRDLDHSLAVKDVVGLPSLAVALGAGRPVARHRPLVWPEHCVDPSLLSASDVIAVGGGDTNFWHAALFEMVWEDFATSSIPLALTLRQNALGERPGRYGSERLAARLVGLSETLVVPEHRGGVILSEREFPTYAMILVARNPLSLRGHTCTFVAGTRSLGTAGAVWALAAMLERMRADPTSNFGSLALTAEADVVGGVAAVLCRTTKVFHAARRVGPTVEPGGIRPIPTDRRDPRYADSYLPAEVEIFVNADGSPRWEVVASASGGTPLPRLTPSIHPSDEDVEVAPG